MKTETTRGKLSSLSLEYAAGFIDADGHIGIAKSKNIRNPDCPRYSLRITVMGIHEGIVRKFLEMFGGSVHCKMTKHGDSCYLPHHRVQWRWEATGLGAVEALKALEPHLIVKKEQAQLAIAFQDRKNEERKSYTTSAVPKEIIEIRERDYLKMRQLKLIGETLESYRSRRD